MEIGLYGGKIKNTTETAPYFYQVNPFNFFIVTVQQPITPYADYIAKIEAQGKTAYPRLWFKATPTIDQVKTLIDQYMQIIENPIIILNEENPIDTLEVWQQAYEYIKANYTVQAYQFMRTGDPSEWIDQLDADGYVCDFYNKRYEEFSAWINTLKSKGKPVLPIVYADNGSKWVYEQLKDQIQVCYEEKLPICWFHPWNGILSETNPPKEWLLTITDHLKYDNLNEAYKYIDQLIAKIPPGKPRPSPFGGILALTMALALMERAK